MKNIEEAKRNIKGQGSYSTLKSGKIRYRITVDYDDKGKPVRLSGTGPTMKKAREAADKKKQDYYSNINNATDNNITLLKWTIHVINEQKANEELEATSYSRDQCVLRNQVIGYTIADIAIKNITEEDLSRYWNELKKTTLAASSMDKVKNLIGKSLRIATEKKVINRNVFQDVKADWEKEIERRKKKEKKEKEHSIVVLSNEQIETLLGVTAQCVPHTNRLYVGAYPVRVLVNTGLRCSDLIALKWKHYRRDVKGLELAEARVKVQLYDENSLEPIRTIMKEKGPKTGRKRIIPLTEETLTVLNEIYEHAQKNNLADEEEYIFLNSHKQPFTSTELANDISKLYEKAGLGKYKSSMHLLRRSFATQLHREGVDVLDIAAYIGDNPQTVIEHYISRGKLVESNGEVVEMVEMPDEFLIPKKKDRKNSEE